MTKYFVYIIYSTSSDIFYKGVTTDIEKRLNDHNIELSTYTKNKGSWWLVFVRSFKLKSDALKYERMLKRQNRKYIEWV